MCVLTGGSPLQGFHIAFWVGGTILPSVAAAHVLLSRERVYPGWAKVVWIIGSFLGYAWGLLGWVIEHPSQYGLDARMYYNLGAIRWFFWGVICGLVTTFALATRRGRTSRPNQSLEPTAGRRTERPKDKL